VNFLFLPILYFDNSAGAFDPGNPQGFLSETVDITLANLSKLKSGKVKAIRFSTLEAVCKTLDCQPGDLLEYSNEDG